MKVLSRVQIQPFICYYTLYIRTYYCLEIKASSNVLLFSDDSQCTLSTLIVKGMSHMIWCPYQNVSYLKLEC